MHPSEALVKSSGLQVVSSLSVTQVRVAFLEVSAVANTIRLIMITIELREERLIRPCLPICHGSLFLQLYQRICFGKIKLLETMEHQVWDPYSQ